jgi:hypothetical protein
MYNNLHGYLSKQRSYAPDGTRWKIIPGRPDAPRVENFRRKFEICCFIIIMSILFVKFAACGGLELGCIVEIV